MVSARLDFERENYDRNITRRLTTNLQYLSRELIEKVFRFNLEQIYDIFRERLTTKGF